MELAAVMRNDEVQDTSSVLTELNLLSISFMQMNDKLLQARPFMPQSLLFNEEEEDENNDVEFGGVVNVVGLEGGDNNMEGDLDDEGSVALNTSKGSMSIAPETPPLNNMSPSQSIAISPSNASLHGGGGGLHQLDMSNSNIQNNSTSIMNNKSNSSTRRNSLPPLKTSSASPGRFHMVIQKVISKNNMLVSKKVAVLVINARGTHRLALSSGAAKLETDQAILVELVEKCSRAEKGVVDSFQGDHFVLTFNAVRAVGTPGRNAALVSLAISTGAQHDGLALGQFSMGLSVGRALVGNVGSATMKKNCTIGAVYTNATGLERLSKRVEHSCLLHGQAMADIEPIAYSLRLGNVSLCNREQDSLWAVKQLVTGASEEWLYEIEAAAERNPYQLQNDAVAQACGEEVAERPKRRPEAGQNGGAALVNGEEAVVVAPPPTMDINSGEVREFAASPPLSLEGSPMRPMAFSPSSNATTPHFAQHAVLTQQQFGQPQQEYVDANSRPLVSLYDFVI